MQTRQRMAPTALVDKIIPLGDQVADRATAHAGGDPAVHAALTLFTQVSLLPFGGIDLTVVGNALMGRPMANGAPAGLEETIRMSLTHRTSRASRRQGGYPSQATWEPVGAGGAIRISLPCASSCEITSA